MHTLTHRLDGTAAVPALACALALAAIGVYGAAVSAHDHSGHQHGGRGTPDATVAEATWVDRPQSVDAATARSLFVVEARVSAIRAGTTIAAVEDTADGLTETDNTPTQLIDFTTRSVIQGPAPSGFTINKTGSSSWYIEGDPPYAVGERYLLFVERFEDENGVVSNYIPLGPDGRLQIDANDLLHAHIDGPMAVELDGKPLETAKGSIRLALLKAGLVPTTTMTASELPVVIGAPTDAGAAQDTAEDALGDADDQVSGTGTGAVHKTDAVAAPSPVTDELCPGNLPIYCPAP